MAINRHRFSGGLGAQRSGAVSTIGVLANWYAYYLATVDASLNPAGTSLDITSWEDQSGNARDADDMITAAEPQIIADTDTAATRIVDFGSPEIHQGLGYLFTAGEITEVNAWTTGTAFVLFKPAAHETYDQHIISWNTEFGTREIAVRIKAADDAIDVRLDNPNGTAGAEITWTPSPAQPVLFGAWHSLVIVHDGTDLKIYINATDVGAVYAEDENGGSALDATWWFADMPTTLKIFALSGLLQSDLGGVSNGFDGEIGGWGLTGDALGPAQVTDLHEYLMELFELEGPFVVLA